MENQTNSLSQEDKTAFIAALKNGLGLTKAAGIIMNTPKAISALLNANKQLLQECTEAVAYAGKAMVVKSADHLNNKQWDKWQENNKYLRAFSTDLILWECYCKKSEIVPGRIVEAYNIYHDMDEVATACGITKKELNIILAKNSALRVMLEELAKR